MAEHTGKAGFPPTAEELERMGGVRDMRAWSQRHGKRCQITMVSLKLNVAR